MTSATAVADRTNVGRTERQQEQTRIQDDKRADIRDATAGVRAEAISAEATRLADGNGRDGFDPNAAAVGTGAGAHRFSAIDPTRGKGIEGAPLSDKVKAQMRPDPRVSITTGPDGRAKVNTPDGHKFPRVVDGAVQRSGVKSFPVVNGDGSIVSGVEKRGTLNGKPGNFQYTVNNGEVNHRQFVPDGKRNPIDANRRIPGTNAARYAGRALLGVGLALDAHEIATSDNIPRTATEKAGAWSASLGSAAVVGKVAAPLLAAGPVGWAGYGVAVVGAGVVGYVGGSKLGRGIYDTVSGWFN